MTETYFYAESPQKIAEKITAMENENWSVRQIIDIHNNTEYLFFVVFERDKF